MKLPEINQAVLPYICIYNITDYIFLFSASVLTHILMSFVTLIMLNSHANSTHGRLGFIISRYSILKAMWEIPTYCSHTCLSAAGDTNDNKTAVGPEDVSKMGCPCLGEHTKLEVVIEESYEFKVTQNKQFFFFFYLRATLTYHTDVRIFQNF